MARENYEIVEDYGVIAEKKNRTGDPVEIKVTLCKWFGKEARWDIRAWSKDGAGAGVVLTDDGACKLRDILNTIQLKEKS